MNNNDFNEIKESINLFYNDYISREIYNQRLRNVFREKTAEQIINEMTDCVDNAKKSNRIVFSIVLALLSFENVGEIKCLITRNDLFGKLYGGILEIINSRSQYYRLKVKCKKIYNPMKVVKYCHISNCFKYSDFFDVLKIISEVKYSEFEKLILNPKSWFFVVNILFEKSLRIYYTEATLKKMLNSSDKKIANCTFYYLIQRLEEKGDNESLETEIKEVFDNIKEGQRKIEFIVNYIILIAFEKSDIPYKFDKILFDEENHDNLIKYLEENKEIINLYVLEKFLDVANRYFSKTKLYNEKNYEDVYAVFYQKFMKNYINGKLESYDIELVKKVLNSFNDNQIKKFICILKTDDKKLFFTDMDRLIRFKLWKNDFMKHRMIEEILTEFTKSKNDIDF